YFVDQTLTRTQYNAVRDGLLDEVARLQRDLLPTRVGVALDLLDGQPRRNWPKADNDTKRRVIGCVMDHVIVYPSPTPNVFAPERVQIRWVGIEGHHPPSVSFLGNPSYHGSNPDQVVTAPEAERLLGISRWAIRGLLARGKLPGWREGRVWRIRRGD